MPISTSMTSIQMIARSSFIAAAIGAIGWAFATMPSFWAERNLHGMATHIEDGETYKPEIMDAAEENIARHFDTLRPSALDDVAIFRLRGAEVALRSSNPLSADAAIAELDRSVDMALAVTPSASFLWLMRFWAANHQNGFEPENLRNLQESYALGANEGWIALQRSRLALVIFSALPPELSSAVVKEFAGLVNSGLFAAASDLLTGPGAPVRNVLLPALSNLSQSTRRHFAEVLYTRQPDGYLVPGVNPTASHPWQH